MKRTGLIVLLVIIAAGSFAQSDQKRWISLFDGKSLNGWKVGDNAATFSVANGAIVIHGETAHLYYDGPISDHQFKDFEFKATVMTTPGSNSGIYIHTTFQQGGWPEKGYEIQVNNSHTDWRRTGSVYALKDLKEVYVKDNVWYTQYIRVKGKTVTVMINDKVINEYTEPENPKGRMLSTGTFALQGHDPNSQVYVKDIMVKLL